MFPEVIEGQPAPLPTSAKSNETQNPLCCKQKNIYLHQFCSILLMSPLEAILNMITAQINIFEAQPRICAWLCFI